MDLSSVTDRSLPSPSRLAQWSRVLAVATTGQVAVQALGFLAGILVIRTLPQDQYALYTVGNAMLGTMTLLADSGISTGVMAQGGRVWNDRERLGAVIATGLELRRRFAVFSLAVCVPVLLVLLRNHGADWLGAAALAAALSAAFLAALSGVILEAIPKLRQEVAALQRIQVVTNVGRLLLLGSTRFFPHAAVAILCSGLAQLWANSRLRAL